MSRHLDILALKKLVERYEVACAKNIFDKSEGQLLGAWRGRIPLPGPFCWSDGGVDRARSPARAKWSKVVAKVEEQVGSWL